ncbi:hypothetical protein OEZ85_003609 [Tetradesmus obliquus]|uniref:Amine oxidase domain-containing protein n=1 Tax=Tetradesmus obliquus TaxID=3088 RepID=A0ABY8UC50_TETOB|nr:hypothetical protein OEZ85_003609 [Tetradesmus obliquus]
MLSSSAAAGQQRMTTQRSNGSQADPVQRARTKMGYKNNWHRNNVNENQVQFTQPLQHDAAVGIIGGGISGLACAQGLSRHGMRAVVFDTGEHGVGGRAATRSSSDASLHAEWISPSLAAVRNLNLRFDHAAQCFTATDPAFQQQVQAWLAAGVVQRWQGPVGVLRPGGTFEPLGDATPLYVATGGMRQLAQHMADEAVVSSSGGVSVVRPMWVSRMTAAHSSSGWQLTGNNKGQGTFGAVVIAHNGKCANRLVGPTGAPDVARQLMRLRLSAVWALMVAFESPVDVPGGMEGAFVQGSPVLSWASNNSAKLGLVHPQPYEGLQCWTLISTDTYGQANKVPQEKVAADVAAKVAAEMLVAFAALLGPAAVQLPKAVFTRVQLWGAALPTNTPNVPCILDAQARVGVCGDWLTGASLQSAVLSGWVLADRLAALRGVQGSAAAGLGLGLTEPFKPLREAEIGEFPGLPKAAVAAASRQQGAGGVSCGSNGGGRGRQQQQQRPRQQQQGQQQQRGGSRPAVHAGGARP